MPFEKGKSGNPKGKPKGTPNKATAEVKAAIMECFDPKAFKAWAKKNPDLFYTRMVQPLIPKEVEAQGLIKLVIMDCLKDNVD